MALATTPVSLARPVLKMRHFQSRQMIIRLADPEYGSLPAPCVVPRVVGRAMPVPHTGPAVGEHNAEIYASLGLDTGALAELRGQGVI